MNKPLSIEPETHRDVIEAYEWYERQRPGLGSDFLLCLEAALQAIAERPKSFKRVKKTARRALMRRFPYLVLFMEKKDHIGVLGVFHTSRDPATWLRRLR